MSQEPLRLPEAEITPPVTMRDVEAFASALGDWNPIHLSTEAARAAGFEGPVLHGMYIAGRFEIYLERIPGFHLRDLQVQFVRPAPVGHSLTISARHLGGSRPQVRLRLLAAITGGPLVAIAEALLDPASDPAQQDE